MRANFDSLIAELHVLDRMPDIIILSEIWVDDHEIQQYFLPDFTMFAKCNNSYRSGGVAVLVSNQLTCVQLDIADMISADCILLQISLSHTTVINLLAVYRLHDFPIDMFTNDLISAISLINSSDLIINGDMNINILDKNNSIDDYLIRLASLGMKSIINEPTRITDISRTCIDHVFYRTKINSKLLFSASVIQTCVTDHMMTALVISVVDIDNSVNGIIESNRLDWDILKLQIKEIDWYGVYSCKTASLAFEKFIVKITECVNNSHVRVATKKRFLKPWMTTDLKKDIDKKNKLYKMHIRDRNDENVKCEYNQFKNGLINKIRQSKKNYYSNILLKYKNNSKKQWATIKELTGEKAIQRKITLKDSSGCLVSCPKSVANILNTFFCTVADDLRGKILEDNADINYSFDIYKSRFRDSDLRDSMFLYPTTNKEVSRLIVELSNNKAPGYDKITPCIVKTISEYIVDVLVFIYNLSLSSGEFPSGMRKSVVTPLFKKNDKLQPTNYRPISLLSIFSKLLEKVVKTRVIEFLSKNNFFSKNQYGFQSGLNTGSAVIDFMSEVYIGINEGSVCAGIFVDVMKAFDTVDHDILLNKMMSAGIRGVANDWFRSYIRGRTQVTKVGDVFSSIGEQNFGIPQGSVLSGLLFLVYLNSLCNGLFKGKLVAFADDTALFYKADSIAELQRMMQDDINALRWWFTNHLMVMSPKTKYIIFSLRKNLLFTTPLKYHEINCNLDIHTCKCQYLEQVDKIKYLGLWVDSKLSWKEHISYLKVKLIKYIRIFYLMRSVCYPNLMRTIYYALINSKIEYGLEIWGGSYFATLKPLIILQKAFIRIISFKKKVDHTFQLFVNLNILPIRNLYVFKTLQIFFDRSGDKKLRDFRRVSRNRLNVIVPKPNLTIFKKFYLYLAPTFFNSLPPQIKECAIKQTFLKLLRNHLINEGNIENKYFNTLV